MGNFLILILKTFKIGTLIKFIACHREALETNRSHNKLKCTGCSQGSHRRKCGFFMSWSWCHHEKKKGKKKKRVEVKPGLVALSPVFEFALTLKNLLQNCMCNLWVICSDYLFFLSPSILWSLLSFSPFESQTESVCFLLPQSLRFLCYQ